MFQSKYEHMKPQGEITYYIQKRCIGLQILTLPEFGKFLPVIQKYNGEYYKAGPKIIIYHE